MLGGSRGGEMLQTMRDTSSVCVSCLGRQSDQPTWDQYCSVSAKLKWSWSVKLKEVINAVCSFVVRSIITWNMDVPTDRTTWRTALCGCKRHITLHVALVTWLEQHFRATEEIVLVSCSFLPIPQQIKPYQHLFREATSRRTDGPNLEMSISNRSQLDQRGSKRTGRPRRNGRGRRRGRTRTHEGRAQKRPVRLLKPLV